MQQRNLMPMVHCKLDPFGGEFGEYVIQDLYFYQLDCLLQPAKKATSAALSTSTTTFEITDTYILNTQNPIFKPEREWDTDEPSEIFLVFMWKDGQWWSIENYSNFSEVTQRGYRQALFYNNRSQGSAGLLTVLEDLNVSPPDFSEVSAFEAAVANLSIKMTFKIEPSFTI